MLAMIHKTLSALLPCDRILLRLTTAEFMYASQRRLGVTQEQGSRAYCSCAAWKVRLCWAARCTPSDIHSSAPRMQFFERGASLQNENSIHFEHCPQRCRKGPMMSITCVGNLQTLRLLSAHALAFLLLYAQSDIERFSGLQPRPSPGRLISAADIAPPLAGAPRLRPESPLPTYLQLTRQ